LGDSWAYAIPYRGIIQEFLKLPELTKEVIEGLVEPATDKSAKEETNKAMMGNSARIRKNWLSVLRKAL